MANAKDRRFRMIFVDRDMSQWSEPPIERRTALATSGASTGKIQRPRSGSGLTWEVPIEALNAGKRAELFYDAGAGVRIARIDYRGVRLGASWGSFFGAGLYVDDDIAFSSPDVRAVGLRRPWACLNHSATPGRLRDARGRRVVRGHPRAPGHQQRYRVRQRVSATTAYRSPTHVDGYGGITASDVIRWLIENYCPDLNADGVQDTSYGIAHLVFRDRVYPYDAMLTVNSVPPLGPGMLGRRHRPLRPARSHRLRLGTPTRRLRNPALPARPRRGGGRERHRSPVHRR